MSSGSASNSRDVIYVAAVCLPKDEHILCSLQSNKISEASVLPSPREFLPDGIACNQSGMYILSNLLQVYLHNACHCNTILQVNISPSIMIWAWLSQFFAQATFHAIGVDFSFWSLETRPAGAQSRGPAAATHAGTACGGAAGRRWTAPGQRTPRPASRSRCGCSPPAPAAAQNSHES